MDFKEEPERKLTRDQKFESLKQMLINWNNSHESKFKDSLKLMWILQIDAENLWEVMDKPTRLFFSERVKEMKHIVKWKKALKNVKTPLEKWMERNKMKEKEYEESLRNKWVNHYKDFTVQQWEEICMEFAKMDDEDTLQRIRSQIDLLTLDMDEEMHIAYRKKKDVPEKKKFSNLLTSIQESQEQSSSSKPQKDSSTK